jgi:DNA-binding CsgD family transcriptional regulator
VDISVIGISAGAERVYRYFLHHPGEGIDAVRHALGIDPDTIEAEVEELGRLGLLDLGDRHRVMPADPTTAIERLIEGRVDRLNDEIRQVLAARAAIPRFAQDRRHGESCQPSLDIERVEGLDQVRRRLDDLAFFSHRETLCLHPGGPLSESAIEAALPLDLRSLRRGLTLKAMYHPDALDDSRMEGYLRDVVMLGGHVHITKAPMDRMVIFDRSVAVVSIDPRDSSRGALLVREPGLVSQLATHFDNVWESAEDLSAFVEPSTNGWLLSRLERRVLAALATTDKDEIAARELDVSVRTFRRHVADIMARLGTVNRFQAGLRAKEEGWI